LYFSLSLPVAVYSAKLNKRQQKELHKITTNVYKLFCHFKPNLNLQHRFCRNPVSQPLNMIPHHEICKHFSISAPLFETEIMDIFLMSSPLRTGFLKETDSVFERIFYSWSAIFF